MFPATGNQDAALHAINARFPDYPAQPARILSVWSRPLFAVIYLIPGQLGGYPLMRVWTVLTCATTAWLVYFVARAVGLPRPWLAVPCFLLQPVLFTVGFETLTEPTFALLLAAGLLAFAHERRLLAATIWAFLPLVRPEGPTVLAAIALFLLPRALRERKFLPIVALGLGVVLWELACIIITRNPMYLRDTLAGQFRHVPTPGPLDHYLFRWPHIVGWPLLIAWFAGLRPSLRISVLRLGLLLTGAVLILHSVLLATRHMDLPGFDRFFTTVSPAIALTATAGLGAIAARRRVPAPALGALALVQAAQAFVALDSDPNAHNPAVTLDALDVARAHFDLRDRFVLPADRFGYVFLDRDTYPLDIPTGPQDQSAAAIEKLPRGTVVLWDNITGDWWFHLTVEDFTARGYRLVWERELTLQSPRARLYGAFVGWWAQSVYDWIAEYPYRPLRQAVLVRE